MVAIPQQPNTTAHELDRAREVSQRAEKPRGHLGASVLGRECKRALWYGFRWTTPANFPGRVLRLFQRGHVEEDLLASEIRSAGMTLAQVDDQTGKQFSFSDVGGHVGGSMDGALHGMVEAPKRWHVFECKTHNDKSFKLLKKDGVKASKPEHEAQMQLYMRWSGMERAAYFALNKNDSEVYIERVKYDHVAAVNLVEKAHEIVTAPEPPVGISEKPTYYLCKWCDHAPTCHGDALPPATCRSCAHTTPELDGDTRWSCAYRHRDLSLADQRTGCVDHVYIPALVPWECVNSSEAENWTEYQLPDNRTLRNGSRASGAFMSSELYAAQQAGSIDVLFDPGVATLRERFDGMVVES